MSPGATRVGGLVSGGYLPDNRRGVNHTGLMHVTDWFPTILDLAGVSYAPRAAYALDGISQKDTILYNATSPRDHVFYGTYSGVINHGKVMTDIYLDTAVAVRNDRL